MYFKISFMAQFLFVFKYSLFLRKTAFSTDHNLVSNLLLLSFHDKRLNDFRKGYLRTSSFLISFSKEFSGFCILEILALSTESNLNCYEKKFNYKILMTLNAGFFPDNDVPS